MGIMKWIRCAVPTGKRDVFAGVQQGWGPLRDVEGFRAQFGGFSRASGSEACIVGVWSNTECYQAFMQGPHDALAKSHADLGTYTSSVVKVGETRAETEDGGEFARVACTLKGGELLRVAECRVRADGREGFIRKQREIWNPGMAENESFLASTCFEAESDPHLFYVMSLWKDAAGHDSYLSTELPVLHERAQPMVEIDELDGWQVNLEGSWTVFAEVDSNE